MAAKNTAAKNTAADEPTRCTCSQFATEDGRTTGCTAETKRLFAPGHDAKLKSFLIKAGAEGAEVTRTVDGIASSADAATHAAKFAFGHMVTAGIKRAETKAAEKAERAAARAAKKTAPKQVTAKVGRWERTGTVEGDTFTYTDAKGATKTTTKFQAV
ncbi:hypothetical protein JL475_06435 [Streptomyces sp. M2CJ-2]|uniref:hypothetical protein n=1 Tax=Streptomyces sp. M2CJ-2 TaxID=2803948 RepID=UPI001923F7B5|nr:hypothetical protein [Streptomyces sp. M2CJ-2]MBL3665644.1 hypothetical protein [Streptomyces sp. M2CJ-2]